jgi:hypothetical protein
LPGVSPISAGVKKARLTTQPFGLTTLSSQGSALNVTGSSLAALTDVILPQPSYPIRLVWCGRITSTGIGPYAGLAGTGLSGSGFYFSGGSSTSIGLALRNNFSSTAFPGQNVPGGSSLNVDLVIVYQSTSATDHRVCVNGSAVAVDTTNITALAAWDKFFIGDSGGANSTQCTAFLYGSGGRNMSDAEMIALSQRIENVYALFAKPAVRSLYSATASGNIYTITPSGGIVFSGAVPLLRTRVQVPSGGISFSGAVPLLRTRVQVPSGGVTFGGTAAITFVPGIKIYTITPSGGISFSGAAPLLRTRLQVPSGGISFAGTAPLVRTRIQLPSGGVVFSGSSPLIFIPAGGALTTPVNRISIGVGRSSSLS